MKQWYLYYTNANHVKLQQLIEVLQSSINQLNTNHQYLIGEIPTQKTDTSETTEFPEVFGWIPWGHHIDIIANCKSLEEAFFYLSKTITDGLSRKALGHCLDAQLYKSSGKAITNFADKLPSSQSALAQEITKDTYDFGFLSLPVGYDEEKLETELEKTSDALPSRTRHRLCISWTAETDCRGRKDPQAQYAFLSHQP